MHDVDMPTPYVPRTYPTVEDDAWLAMTGAERVFLMDHARGCHDSLPRTGCPDADCIARAADLSQQWLQHEHNRAATQASPVPDQASAPPDAPMMATPNDETAVYRLALYVLAYCATIIAIATVLVAYFSH